MANIKSQIKRNRQNDKKRKRNRVYRGEARIAVRNARTNIEEGVPESKAALQEAISSLDKAVEQGVLHKNNAARRKSRLMKAYNKMEPVKMEASSTGLEPVLEAEPAKKKAAPRRPFSRKVAEPKAEALVEPKSEATEEPASEPKKKAAATKKLAAKKVEAKKPAAKKPETKKKTAVKKTSATK